MAIDLGDGEVTVGLNLDDISGDLRQLSSALGRGLTAAGLAATAAFTGAIKASADFSKGLAEVNTLGVESLENLKEGIKALSVEFGQTLGDSVQATYDIISAGVPEADALFVLEESARAAVAGVTDVSTAVDLGTSIINAFGLEARDTGKAFDQAFLAVKEGKTTFDELAAVVGRVAPTFKAVGLESDDLFASIAQITKAGISTKEAVTGLRSALANILRPTEIAKETAAELGITFNQSALEAKGLSGFLDDVKESAGGNVQTMVDLFGSVEAFNVISVLAGDSAAEFSALIDDMGNSVGTTAEAFNKFVEADPGFAFKQAKVQVAALATEIGDELVPVLGKLLTESIVPFLESIREWIKENPELAATLIKVAAAAGVVASVLGPLLIIMPGLIATFTAFQSVVGAVAAAVGTSGLVAALSGPGAAIALIAAAGVATAETTRQFLKWRDAVESARAQERQREDGIRRLINALRDQGVEIDNNALQGKSLEEQERILIELQREHVLRTQQQNETISEATAQRERFNEKQQDLIQTERELTAVSKALATSTFTNEDAAAAMNVEYGSLEASLKNMEDDWDVARQKVDNLARSLKNAEEALESFQAKAGGGDKNATSFEGLAHGGIVGDSGVKIVGEQGPELIANAKGAKVFNAAQTRQIMGGEGGGGPNITMHAEINLASGSPMDAERMRQALASMMDDMAIQSGTPTERI